MNLKKSAQQAISDVEDLHRDLAAIIQESDPVTLENIVLTGKFYSATKFSESPDERDKWGRIIVPDFPWYESRSKGCIIVCWLPGCYIGNEKAKGLDWEAFIKGRASYFVSKILDEIYDIEFTETMEDRHI